MGPPVSVLPDIRRPVTRRVNAPLPLLAAADIKLLLSTATANLARPSTDGTTIAASEPPQRSGFRHGPPPPQPLPRPPRPPARRNSPLAERRCRAQRSSDRPSTAHRPMANALPECVRQLHGSAVPDGSALACRPAWRAGCRAEPSQRR